MTWNSRSIGILAALVSSAMVGGAGCGQQNTGAHTKGISAHQLQNDGQIIGGEEATGEEDFSKTVALIYNDTYKGICTASILTSSILLTAAHCVDGPADAMSVIFGTDFFDRENVQTRDVLAYEVSPSWHVRQNQRFTIGDIAIVRFAGGLPPGYKAADILLESTPLYDGQPVFLAGYGNSDGVKKTGSGRLRFVKTKIRSAHYPNEMADSEILIEQSFGKGACHGDSGGPAYIKHNGQLWLIGVTSRGGLDDLENDCSKSAVYTSVPFYVEWITRTAMRLSVLPERPTGEIALALGM